MLVALLLESGEGVGNVVWGGVAVVLAVAEGFSHGREEPGYLFGDASIRIVNNWPQLVKIELRERVVDDQEREME